MTMLYNSYPYWRYTPSKNGEREGLFVGDPLPLMVAHAKKYHHCKENKQPCAFVIEELTESDLPGPSLEDDLPVFEMLHKRLQENKIDQNDVYIIMPSINFSKQYDSWCRNSNQNYVIKNRYTYPFYFLTLQRKYEYVKEFNNNRDKHLMSLNGAVKPMRLDFVNFCKQNKLMENYISLVDVYNTTEEKVEPITLDIKADNLIKDDKIVPKELMANSWLNVINETHEDDTVFFTEKSWKPILNLQLFLYYGTRNAQAYYENLKSYGFKLYDEILNYDNDPKQEILKFCSTPLDQIAVNIEAVKEKMFYNQQLALDTDWQTKYHKVIYEQISNNIRM
jgi:hypothetical protein